MSNTQETKTMLITTVSGRTLRIKTNTVHCNITEQHNDQFAEVAAISESGELVDLYMGWGKAAVRHAQAMVASIKS
jgi:hypothetical protein